jgi:predicted signal transduction protein with EAL and GGDEF domain
MGWSRQHLAPLPAGLPHQHAQDRPRLISGVNHNPSNSAIATSVIALGHQLHLNVIAEGVETQEDLDFLKSRDCDEYQGFLYSRPVPIDELKLQLINGCSHVMEPAAVGQTSDAA